MINEKKCRICTNIKSYQQFSKRKSSADGFNYICKQCDNILNKERYMRKKQQTNINNCEITEKKCTICNEIKLIQQFKKRLYSTLGYYSECISCTKIKSKVRTDKIIKKRLEILEKLCINCNKTKSTLEFHKQVNNKDGFCNLCITCNNIYRKENIIIINNKKCNKCNIIKEVQYFHKSISKKDGYATICKNCSNESKKNNLENRKNYEHLRYINDPIYKIIKILRSRLYKYLKTKNIKKNNNKTFDSIGLDPILFNNWIEWNKELDNLNNDIHLDHLIPLDSFQIKNWEDIIDSKCNHWTNIRPMNSINNLIKSNKMPDKSDLLLMNIRIYIFKKKNNII